MVSKVYPEFEDIPPELKPTKIKLSKSASCLESIKSQIKLKRAKSAENLTFRDKD